MHFELVDQLDNIIFQRILAALCSSRSALKMSLLVLHFAAVGKRGRPSARGEQPTGSIVRQDRNWVDKTHRENTNRFYATAQSPMPRWRDMPGATLWKGSDRPESCRSKRCGPQGTDRAFQNGPLKSQACERVWSPTPKDFANAIVLIDENYLVHES